MNTKDCEFCENTGVKFAANGTDDFTVEYCSCDEGVRAEEAGSMKHLPVTYVQSEGEVVIKKSYV